MIHWKEEMPTPEQRERAISAIVELGLAQPPRAVDNWQVVFHARVLFFGITDCIALSVLAALLLLIPLLPWASQMASPASALFFISPVLYALLLGLSSWKEGQSGLLDWRRSCLISPQVIAALRMAVFGGGSVLVCVPVNLWLWRIMGGKLPLSWMLGVSLSSLFLYGVLSLACLEGLRRGRLVAAPGIWLALSGVLQVWKGAAAWLTALPGAVFLGVAGAALVLYLWKLKRFCLEQRRGEHHAFC